MTNDDSDESTNTDIMEWTIKMRWRVILGLLFLHVSMVGIGGLIFSYLEKPREDTIRLKAKLLNELFLANHTCIGADELRKYVLEVLTIHDHGIVELPNITNSPIWSFQGAAFFVGMTATTVGYGDTSPETDGGKFLCIVYAFTSIPVTAVLMIGLGKKFYGMMKFIAQKIITNEEHESARLVLSLFLQLITGITSMTLLPAWIIAKYEGWSMVDSIYYNIVTLTTIGYGDFVVGQDYGRRYPFWYMILILAWNFLGLAYMAGTIYLIGDIVHAVFHRADTKIVKHINKHRSKWKAKNSVELEDIELPLISTHEKIEEESDTR